jgi:peptide/nickel transport system permease protein
VQYVLYVTRIAQGDLGTSILTRRPVTEHIWERLPATVELGFVAMFLSVLIGVPLGMYSAVRRGGALDGAARVFAVLGQSMPTFWLGLMLILLFAVALGGLLPAYGRGTLSHLILPALTLAAAPLAQNVRLIRAGMLEVLQHDYVRTARAKGLAERRVVYRHALKNAAVPFLTVSGLSLGFMLSGTIVIESVFSWPGLGRLIVQAVPGRDFPVIQAAVFLFALLFVAVNLVVDVLQGLLDPRARVFEPTA